ncbi:unnamed protein product [Acanthoscelides obtectus]|uniref:Tc1-like transposase DDE domain-containing protein n=1 Tax=Acanthoscelides obtectus TaxID=200917 RepID=A0A9P0PXF2_ACAOB|nr:unnamed protein product [Acanthoscelides obtectus]CAK1678171.1 Histone-lysine N-methyltransferase SETMAR [Acanthoscelides obtectus]
MERKKKRRHTKSPLIFIRGNMNAQRYIHEVLEPHLLPYRGTLADPTFQQDNARPHVARVTIDFFQHNDVTLLPWPPRSPDLSPIEHVWDMMGRRLVNLQRPPQTLEALREELVVAWNEIPQEDIDHLIRSMPRRVGECVAHQECLAELLSVFGNEAPHQSTISRWYGEFKRGRVRLSDDPRVGAPKTAVTQENVDAVRKLIIEDRHVTYREIEASLKISKTSIQKNLHEELGVRKLVSRWIPHLLTEEQKAARVNWCQKTLDCFDSGNSKNVYSIVSGDESWIYCYEPENKRQSAVWVFQGEEKPIKVIRSRSQRSVTADWYTTICLPKVITELRKINPERIILHRDNASSHTAQKTRQYLTEENVELLDHPPYSPDLSPSDFFTFPKIKNSLRGQRFQSPEEAVDALKNAVLDLPANEWNKCFENCFERMQMCINLRGEYFEKQ